MKILVADDEKPALKMLTDAIHKACPEAEISAFSEPADLLACVATENFDVAFLDIRMRGLTGLELAKRLKDTCKKTNIIFVTGYDSYTGDAMEMHASGYILKPVTEDKIKAELADLRHPLQPKDNALLTVKCFGNFEIYTPSGEIVRFERAKSKELFAYLVYREGASCSVKELAATIFEDKPYDKKQQAYLQKIISSMTQMLRAVGATRLIKKHYNSIALDTSLVDCDYYRFMSSDMAAINSYTGEFMSQYSWAEFVIGYLDDIHQEKRTKKNDIFTEVGKRPKSST